MIHSASNTTTIKMNTMCNTTNKFMTTPLFKWLTSNRTFIASYLQYTFLAT